MVDTALDTQTPSFPLPALLHLFITFPRCVTRPETELMSKMKGPWSMPHLTRSPRNRTERAAAAAASATAAASDKALLDDDRRLMFLDSCEGTPTFFKPPKSSLLKASECGLGRADAASPSSRCCSWCRGLWTVISCKRCKNCDTDYECKPGEHG